jgi:hypothetical protein
MTPPVADPGAAPAGSGCADLTSTGSHTLNVEPTAGALSTVIRPPINSASSRQIASPSPLPPNRRLVDSSACVKGWKIFSAVAASIPIPVSDTVI